MRSDDGGFTLLPVVDVKVYDWPPVSQFVAWFGCTEELAEGVSQWVYETARNDFWGWYLSDVLDDVLGEYDATAYATGRSGGWVVVDGLPPVDTWDAVMLGRWRRFEKMLKEAVEWYSSSGRILEAINEYESVG